MAMPVMAVMAVSMMAVMAMSMMAVMAAMSMMTSAVTTVTAVTTTSEGLARNGKGSSCQRQSSDRGCDNLLDASHRLSHGLSSAGIALR